VSVQSSVRNAHNAIELAHGSRDGSAVLALRAFVTGRAPTRTFHTRGVARRGTPSPSLRWCLVQRTSIRWLLVAPFAAALGVAPALSLRAQAAPAAVPAASEITLLETGAAPRQVLRYTLAAGTREAMKLRQSISMRMEMGGMAQPAQAMPATLMTTEMVVSDVAPDGSAGIATEIVDIDLDTEGADPGVVAAMRPALAAFKGVTMRYRVSQRGEVSQLTFGEGVPPEMQTMQSLGSTEQLSVAFPREAVGVGARWKATRPVQQNGLTITQDVEYVVKALAADSVLLELNLVQSAKDQTMQSDALPPGASITLRTLAGTGTSTVAIRFDRVQPAMTMTMSATMALDLEMGGQSNAMKQTMAMEMSTTPAAARATPPDSSSP
jgi:hypothetical protein